jgi:hypothetical protein
MADPLPLRMMWTLIPKSASPSTVTLTAFLSPQPPPGADLSILRDWPCTMRRLFGCASAPLCNCGNPTQEGRLELIFAADDGMPFPPLQARVETCVLDGEMWKLFFGDAEAPTELHPVKDATQYLLVSNHASAAGEHLETRYAEAFDRHARGPRAPQVASLALDQEGSPVQASVAAPVNRYLDPWADEPDTPSRETAPPKHSVHVSPPPAGVVTTEPSRIDRLPTGIQLTPLSTPPPPAAPPTPAPVPPPASAPSVPSPEEELQERFMARMGLTKGNQNAPIIARLYAQQQLQMRTGAVTQPSMTSASGNEYGSDLEEAAALLGAIAFHRRSGGDQLPPPQTSDAATPELDLSRRFAYLNSHPSLLRPLGLVVTVEADADPKTLQRATRVRLNVHKDDCDRTEHCSPWTCIAVTPAGAGWRFSAVQSDAGSLLTGNGLLDLERPEYRLETRDVDGTAAKYVSAENSRRNAVGGTPAAPPAVRSIGISLVQSNRTMSIDAMLKRTASLSCTSPAQNCLTMEDLVRGFIAEVECDAQPGVWYPLGWRDETFLYGKVDTPPEKLSKYRAGARHGIVRTTADHVMDRAAELSKLEELHVAEALFRWDGWSLTVPPILAEPVENPDMGAPSVPWCLETVFTALNLPRLRFGYGYRFRLRAADLAGDPFLDEVPASAATRPPRREAPFSYLRYDPVSPPIVLLTSPLRKVEVEDKSAEDGKRRLAGESLRHLVIRSPMRRIEDEAVERCLLPPMTTFRMAEQHGMYAHVKPETLGGVKTVKLERADERERWHLPIDADSNSPIARNTPGRDMLEYLPDPMAKRVCIRIQDLVTGETHHPDPIPFYDATHAWPNAKRIRIRLQPRPDGAARIGWEWRPRAEMLVIGLPPGWSARLLLSSGFDDCDLPLFGQYRDWKTKATSNDPCVSRCGEQEHAEIRHKILCGCHQMLSPVEELTLVHAVPEPLRTPALADLNVFRKIGSTSATIDSTVDLDRKSTGRIDIDAEWMDIDDVGEDHSKHQVTLEPLEIDAPDVVGDFDAQGLSQRREALEHQFGDTRCRRVRYTPRAVARFSPYYAEPSSRAAKTPVEVMIPSSARPPAPVIQSIIPSFSWSQEKEKFPLEPWRRFHSRRTSALRIWLDGGWFASGEDEMLGVVLWPSITDSQAAALERRERVSLMPEGRVPPEIEPYVTRWGGDPIWRANEVTSLPTANHFLRADRYASNLMLAEGNGRGRVCVAGHRPRLDDERRALYCDIEIHPVPSYFGFVRLAFVRYQPHSLEGAEISPVAVAGFAQLLPDRAVTVRRAPNDRRTLVVEIFGTGSDGGAADCRNQINLSVETRCPSMGGEFVWSPEPLVRVETTVGSREALWSGTVTIGDTPLDRRLVVREFEIFQADGETTCTGDETTKTKTETCNSAESLLHPQLARRLIYADVLDLS